MKGSGNGAGVETISDLVAAGVLRRKACGVHGKGGIGPDNTREELSWLGGHRLLPVSGKVRRHWEYPLILERLDL